jgi:hypothetical protein
LLFAAQELAHLYSGHPSVRAFSGCRDHPQPGNVIEAANGQAKFHGGPKLGSTVFLPPDNLRVDISAPGAVKVRRVPLIADCLPRRRVSPRRQRKTENDTNQNRVSHRNSHHDGPRTV